MYSAAGVDTESFHFIQHLTVWGVEPVVTLYIVAETQNKTQLADCACVCDTYDTPPGGAPITSMIAASSDV